jgi:5-formyltetrahydrofolate cyclo-ligase
VSTDPQDSSLATRKRAVRERALAARDALPAAARAEKSARITAALVTLDECVRARCVMAYVPVRSEFDTRPLLERLLAAGVVLALPRITGPRVMVAARVTDLARDLVPGAFGIPAPRDDLEALPPERLDCVLVPGSAFDLEGRRSGYGGGYYDNLVALMRPDCHRVAAAFDVQVVDEVPAEPHDLPVHVLVTETRAVDFRR